MKDPRVSVVIPAYNHEKYVGEAIQSVLDQTFQNFELIIINDGATDNTETEILKFKDERIRYYFQENRGLSATLNRGIELARGEYFNFLPSDDAFLPEKLAIQLKVFEESENIGLVFSYHLVVDGEGKEVKDDPIVDWFTVPFGTKEEIFPSLFERDFLSAPTALVKMECFKKVGLFDESLKTAQDYDLWMRILKYYDLQLIKRPLLKLRWHGANLTYQTTPATELERGKVLLKAYRDLNIEDIFPSLHQRKDAFAYAEAYEKLATYMEKSGIPALLPISQIYKNRGKHLTEKKEDIFLFKREDGEESEEGFYQGGFGGDSGKIHLLIETRSLDKGGLEEVIYGIVTHLDPDLFLPVVVCIEAGGFTADRIRKAGIPVEVLGEEKEKEYIEILNQYRIDLVNTHYSFFGSAIAYQKGIPVISVLHSIYSWYSGKILDEFRKYDKYVSKYIAVSAKVASFSKYRFNVDQKRLRVIPDGIDIGRFEGEEIPEFSIRKNLGLHEDDFIVLHVGAINPAKMHNLLVAAMRELAKTHPKVKLLCIGQVLNEEYYHFIQNKIEEYHLDQYMKLIGFVENLGAYYQSADAFVMPSLIEGWGIATLEAMYHGLPLILTRVGGAEELIEDQDIGILIDNCCSEVNQLTASDWDYYSRLDFPPNAPQLIEAMLEIYRNQKEWKNKSNEGRKKVLARYTWDKIIPEYEKEFIALALENRGRWKIRLIGSLRDQRVRLDEQERRLADHIGERGVLRKMIEDQTAVIQNQAELIRDQRIRLEEQGRNYAQEVAKRDEQIHALSSQLNQTIAEKDNIWNQLNQPQEILLKKEDRIRELLARNEEQGRNYAREVAKRDEQVNALSSQLNEAISEENELGSRLNETLKERDTVWNQLNQIYLSNFWKVASWYYKIRNKSLLIRSIYVAVKWLKKNIKRKPVVENGSKFTSPEPKVDRLTAEVTLQPAPKIHRSKKTPQYEVICLPIIDWFFRFQRPQQILSQFAKNGSRVFYINPKFLGESEGYFQAKEIRENIFDISIAADTSLNIYTGRIDEKNLDMMIKSFENLRREMGIVEAICIVQLPFWQPLAKKVKEDFGWKIIYDCMDEHSGFSTNEESMLSHEELLARECNLLVTTASPLYEKMRTYNERCILLPNAADFNHFSYLPPNEILREIEKPIIGYYGAISDWFDEELVEYLAKNKEDWNFVFIGHTFGSNISKLQQMANVHFLGEEPYSELPKYLYWFDVCIIPFKLNNLIRATSPVKFYEFMSSGKKVVSVEIPELLPFSKYLYLAKDKNDFLKKIEMALQENDQNIVSERIELAKKNTWEERYHILSSEIKNIYPEASIIIVTYNNLNYTKLCIESLFSKTQYPNFEIIIVDNNSTDGTKDYLRDLADKKNEVKVIFNSDNKGFPKGNNQGILAASGEYIVFLNNDTVVTRGWLSKLIKHLENKDIGIVGPVTNFCGNEAKIDVPYKNIEEMDGFSEGYLRKNMEPVEFDIKVLAMYCLVMKKRLIEEVGLLDERFEIGMFEDDDFSHRVRLKGYRVVCVEDVFIHHFGEVSFNKLKESGEYMKLFDRNKKRFEKKWGIKWEPHKYRETKN